MAVKTRFALVYLDEDGDIREAIMSGQPVASALTSKSEIGEDYLLRTLEGLKRMAVT